MLTYPWKCTVLHCNHLGNTWKPLVLMTRHFDYCPSSREGDNQSARSSAPVVSRCFPGAYNVKLYISRGRLAWWLLAFLQCCGFNTGVVQRNMHFGGVWKGGLLTQVVLRIGSIVLWLNHKISGYNSKIIFCLNHICAHQCQLVMQW